MSIDRRRAGSRRKTVHRRRRVRPWMVWTGVAALGVAVAVCGVVVVQQLVHVRGELESTLRLLPDAESQLAAGDPASAGAAIEQLQLHTSAARESTVGLPWWLGEQIPVLGNNLVAVRTAAEVADDIVQDALVPFSAISLDELKPIDGRIAVEEVSRVAGIAVDAAEVLADAAGRVDRLERIGLLPPVSEALEELERPLAQAAAQAEAAAPLLRILPALLGAEGERNYVVMFQNSAELRALGGIPGASVLVHVADGQVGIVQTVGGGEFIASDGPIVPLPPDAAALYDGLVSTAYLNVTGRPDFPYAARSASAFWQTSHGVAPDAVFSLDPVALSYFMRATGPVELETGQVLSSENIVSQLLNQVYRDNPGLSNEANEAQDAYFETVVDAVFARLTSGQLDLPAAAAAWNEATNQRRLMLWSADSNEQTQLVRAGLSGSLPESNGTTNAFGLYFGDAVGSKLDYYLRDQTSIDGGACSADGERTVRVSTDLTNTITVESDYASEEFDYITGFWEREGLEEGAIRLRVWLYAPERADIVSATFDGEALAVAPNSDDGRPVAFVVVTVPPGETKTLSFDVAVRHSSSKVASLEVTPTVALNEVIYNRPTCS